MWSNGVLLFMAVLSAGSATGEPFLYCLRDAKFKECINFSLKKMYDGLVAGIPELEMPPQDPKHFKEALHLDFHQPGVNLSFVIKDMNIGDFSKNVVILDSELDPDKYIIRLKTIRPVMHMTATYSIKGHVLGAVPVWGDGPMKVTMTDVKDNVLITGKELIKDGKRYMEITNINADIQPQGMVQNLEKLYDGFPIAGPVINTLVNLNWKLSYQLLHPRIKVIFGNVVGDMFRIGLRRTALDESFPTVKN